MLFYVLIAGALLARVVLGVFLGRRVRRSGKSVSDGRAIAGLVHESRRLRSGPVPALMESPSVSVPVTLGLLRPIILLPAAWRDWSDEKLRMVLAHELSHVERRDALTRALAALYGAIFWFSPLAWWLERHLGELAEQASDDAALGVTTDRAHYAEVLLGFYRDLQGAVGHLRWEGAAMTSGKQAQRRVDRILDSSRRISAGLRKPVYVGAALLAAPIVYLSATVRPVAANRLHPSSARVVSAALASSTDASPSAGLQAPPAPAAPAEPQAAPAPAAAPAPPKPPKPMEGSWTEDVMISYGPGRFSGSGTYHDYDLKHLDEVRRASNSDIIWFRRNGKAYVIRDAATVRQAKALMTPHEALGKQQEELDAQQALLGRTTELVRVEVPDLDAELEKLKVESELLHKNGATQDELGDLQTKLGELQEKLGELQGKAGEQQGALGAKQGELGARQGKLGEQQGKLGEEQARLAEEASRKMKTLLDNALAKGLAQPE